MHPRVHARTHARTHALTHTVPDEVWVGGGGGGWGVPKEQIMYTQERTSSDRISFTVLREMCVIATNQT